MKNMIEKLHYHTITPQLKSALNWLMAEDVFNPFGLVEVTALSLQLGHRKSGDTDMFSDLGYGDIDFEPICLLGKFWEIILSWILLRQLIAASSNFKFKKYSNNCQLLEIQ